MVSGVVRAQIIDRCVVLTVDRPPLNAIGAQICADLDAAVVKFDADAEIDAIVVGAEGRGLSVEPDVEALGDAEFAATLARLCTRIEDCETPVIAALRGTVRGPGLALALAARHRVGQLAVTLGLPEINLGLVACGGVTQRLPRLIGPVAALQMLISGKPVNDTVAKRLGLLDRLVDADVMSGAVDFAQEIGIAPAPVTRVRDLRTHTVPGKNFLDALHQARVNGARTGLRKRIVDIVESGLLLPFAVYTAHEIETCNAARVSEQSRALRHIYRAERAADGRVMTRDGQGYVPTNPGLALIGPLTEAQDHAVVALRNRGITEADIDGAMVDLGYQVGAFGARSGPVGPDTVVAQRSIVAAIAAEGARLVSFGRAAHFSDIDALTVHLMGFPRAKGGAMQAAQAMGLIGLLEDMKGWAESHPVWDAPQIMRQAALLAAGFDAVQSEFSA